MRLPDGRSWSKRKDRRIRGASQRPGGDILTGESIARQDIVVLSRSFRDLDHTNASETVPLRHAAKQSAIEPVRWMNGLPQHRELDPEPASDLQCSVGAQRRRECGASPRARPLAQSLGTNVEELREDVG